MACAPSENSDQPGHPPSLIRVFVVRMKIAWVLSYPLNAQRRLWSDWADAQADLSLRWAHSHFVGLSWGGSFVSYCRCSKYSFVDREFMHGLPWLPRLFRSWHYFIDLLYFNLRPNIHILGPSFTVQRIKENVDVSDKKGKKYKEILKQTTI